MTGPPIPDPPAPATPEGPSDAHALAQAAGAVPEALDVAGYRVALDDFAGPMDLLLQLIRDDELSVERLPLARITDQYVGWLESQPGMDLSVHGDFLVMAATLLELKSRALLPTPPVAELEGDEGPDPRLELVRKLLEYRRIKALARALEAAAWARARRYARPFALDAPEEPLGPGLVLEELSLEDLRAAFGRVVQETGLARPRTLVADDVPLTEHIARIRTAVDEHGTILLRDLCPVGAPRHVLVGTFIGVLELIRQNAVGVEQETPFGDVRIFRRDDAPAELPTGDSGIVREPDAERPPVQRPDDAMDAGATPSSGADGGPA